MQCDEFGVEEEMTVVRTGACLAVFAPAHDSCRVVSGLSYLALDAYLYYTAPVEAYAKKNVFVPPILAKWLRPHQREGVQFMYECVMGLKGFDGRGCILAGMLYVVYFNCQSSMRLKLIILFVQTTWVWARHCSLSVSFILYSRRPLLPVERLLPSASLLYAHAL